MAPVVPNPNKIRAFDSQKAFYDWLGEHHDSEDELWLRLYKKGSGVATVSNLEAVHVALCWGWIDGIRKGLDETSFLQRFTPRRAKSIWSQVNRDYVAQLEAAGRMTTHGRRQVDLAKADGRWDAAYAPSGSMEMPADLVAAIQAEPKALETFRTLNAQNRFALGFRLGNLKTEAGRVNKIKAFVEMLAEGRTIYPNGKGAKP